MTSSNTTTRNTSNYILGGMPTRAEGSLDDLQYYGEIVGVPKGHGRIEGGTLTVRACDLAQYRSDTPCWKTWTGSGASEDIAHDPNINLCLIYGETDTSTDRVTLKRILVK